MMKSGNTSTRNISKMPLRKVSRKLEIKKINQVKNNFTGVPDTDMLECFNRSTWNPAIHQQHPGTSHLILGDSFVRVLQNLRTSCITTMMAFGGATVAQLFRVVKLMNQGRIVDVMILKGTNKISRSSDSEEG